MAVGAASPDGIGFAALNFAHITPWLQPVPHKTPIDLHSGTCLSPRRTPQLRQRIKGMAKCLVMQEQMG